MKILKILLFALLFSSLNFAQAQESKNIVVLNQYWAKDGKIEEVYQHRLYASEIRRKLGLAVGRVLLNTELDGKSPHVIWECEYPSIEARKKDTKLLLESGQFDDVMEKMGKLIDKFERRIYEVTITP